jgi:hypothetical protein
LAALTTGLFLLALFIPQHIMLWARFPVWYHLTFLFSLVPLAYLWRKDCVALPHCRSPSKGADDAGGTAAKHWLKRNPVPSNVLPSSRTTLRL